MESAPTLIGAHLDLMVCRNPISKQGLIHRAGWGEGGWLGPEHIPLDVFSPRCSPSLSISLPCPLALQHFPRDRDPIRGTRPG